MSCQLKRDGLLGNGEIPIEQDVGTNARKIELLNDYPLISQFENYWGLASR
jgi:hypothetical protein